SSRPSSATTSRSRASSSRTPSSRRRRAPRRARRSPSTRSRSIPRSPTAASPCPRWRRRKAPLPRSSGDRRPRRAGAPFRAPVSPAAAAAAAPPEPVELDESTFGGIQARAIGPAVTGGRVAAIDAVPDSPTTIYVGAASGGVWKSIDGGISWKPVFDEHTQSIGAIAIDPKSPQTVWVGTGESWTRNSVSVGDGLYRTTNGGDSWERIGLE